MNKKELKESILNKGGEIINNRKFKYNGTIYYFHYFIKNWKQRVLLRSKFIIKFRYWNLVKIFEKEKIVKKQCGKFFKNWGLIDLFGVMSYLGIIFWIFYEFIVSPFFWLIFSCKNKYSNIDERIKTLEKFCSAAPFYPKLSKNHNKKRGLGWAFSHFIINNYALKTNKKVTFSIENYIKMRKINKYWYG